MRKTGMRKLQILSMSVFLMSSCKAADTVLLPSGEALSPLSSETAESWLDQSIPSFLNDGSALPDTLPDGRAVTWQVEEGSAYTENNIIRKHEDASEYESITLLAEADGISCTVSDVLLLDPYAGYVISYFSEETNEPESMKLALTFNCKYWFKLNEDSSVLKAESGTKRLRDPSIIRKKDGTFAVTATQGYDNPSVYVFDSEDLITYTNERLLKVNCSSADLQLSEKQAWAPEGFYDRTIDAYVIYWSSVEDGSMYYNTSPDLTSFSYPAPFSLCMSEVIDGTIVKESGGWYMILKDERQPMEEHSQLMIASSGKTWNTYENLSEPFSQHQSEGPMIMKDLENDGYYIFFDDYTRYQFKAYYCAGSDFSDAHMIEDSELLIPLEKPAHSYALPLTWKEIERLMNAYGS